MSLVEYTISLLHKDGWRLSRDQSWSIVHIGANSGQEVDEYEKQGWTAYHVEALPDLFKIVLQKCLKTKNQHAIQACLSDSPGQDVTFYVANNQGQSSSLLRLGRHAHTYPSIKYTSEVKLKTDTLDQLLANQIIPEDIQRFA